MKEHLFICSFISSLFLVSVALISNSGDGMQEQEDSVMTYGMNLDKEIRENVSDLSKTELMLLKESVDPWSQRVVK